MNRVRLELSPRSRLSCFALLRRPSSPHSIGDLQQATVQSGTRYKAARSNTCRKDLHTMDHIPEPSGKRLPLFLLKKWQAQHLTAEDRSSTQSDERKSDQPSRQTKARASMFSNQVFAAEEIGDRLYKTSIVITDIQKQIERGEEICKSACKLLVFQTLVICYLFSQAMIPISRL